MLQGVGGDILSFFEAPSLGKGSLRLFTPELMSTRQGRLTGPSRNWINTAFLTDPQNLLGAFSRV